MRDRTYSATPPILRLPSLHYGHTIVLLSQQGRKETTSTEVFLVPCLRLTNMSTAARTLVGGGRGFLRQNLRRIVPNHGYEARAELKAGSCDWLRRLWWLCELALGSRELVDRKGIHGKG